MRNERVKGSATPFAGYRFQSLFGVQVLTDWLSSPATLTRVRFECDDKAIGPQGLDDIVAERADGRFDYLQVKYTPPEAANGCHLLRVSLEDLPFEHHTRELVTNAIGRFLLRRARKGLFKNKPLVVMLDEAHQFLDKSVGDEYNKTSLDSFGLIAKEGRKYGLTCVLATQRPRDIPEDVLSQMGMFVVHRLINDRDRTVVERACGNLDQSAASFLPTLGQGEAILVGVESPMPLPVRIRAPNYAPESKGPDYANCWG